MRVAASETRSPARLDGAALAERLVGEVTERTRAFKAQAGRAPGLHVILVGEDPASAVYVGRKEKKAGAAGFVSRVHRLPSSTDQAELLDLIQQLNDDDSVDGILVQLPLPRSIDEGAVLRSISTDKDVDGFHVVNAGALMLGAPQLVPSTPRGCMMLIQSTGRDVTGLEAVVIGRSNIVGKPMAHLLLAANCTVTIAHSRTRNLAGSCARADILVAAVGSAEMVRGGWIKPGAIVIDVGINRVGDKLVGDVAYEEAIRVASHVTPVPGGVGPMTIACLLDNTLLAAERRLARAAVAAIG
jgi:methylenetetrahydrofolate dehydrogenase (NADP+)/methenyltetrahydrofolate cyclohydrolase